MSLIGVESPSASPIFVSSVGALILFCFIGRVGIVSGLLAPAGLEKIKCER